MRIIPVFLVFSVMIFSSCGRKQRTIFSFDEKSVVHVNKLAFPAVRSLTAVASQDGVYIHWDPINGPFEYHAILVGYNIYKVTDRHFIGKKPLNKVPVEHPQFWDRKKRKAGSCRGYIVRGVFCVEGSNVVGPASSLAIM
jgi:hypothetical protein